MDKPVVTELTGRWGEHGNIFVVLGASRAALKEEDRAADADKMVERVYACDSYEEALSIVQEYVVLEGDWEPEEDEE